MFMCWKIVFTDMLVGVVLGTYWGYQLTVPTV